jgi:hypothetical protein
MIRRVLRKVVPSPLLEWLHDQKLYRTLPAAAKELARRDARGLPLEDPGAERAILGALRWLARAQDCSASQDGGAARHFSLIDGWAPSYPETTGYIVPTLLETRGDPLSFEMRRRATRMLDWLVSIQLPGGAFQGGRSGHVQHGTDSDRARLRGAAGSRGASRASDAPRGRLAGSNAG